MPLLSSPLLLRSQSLILLTTAYYLLTAPSQILSSALIWILGESMHIRPPTFAHDVPLNDRGGSGNTFRNSFSPTTTTSERELLALVALLLTMYAVIQLLFAGDLAALPVSAAPTAHNPPPTRNISANVEINNDTRLAEQVHTLLTAQSRWMTLAALRVLSMGLVVFWIYVFHSSSSSWSSAAASGFRLLANRVVFTGAFLDMLFCGYLWTVLKEEGREVRRVIAETRRRREEME